MELGLDHCGGRFCIKLHNHALITMMIYALLGRNKNRLPTAADLDACDVLDHSGSPQLTTTNTTMLAL